jgi:uncharacterized metal-binding protein
VLGIGAVFAAVFLHVLLLFIASVMFAVVSLIYSFACQYVEIDMLERIRACCYACTVPVPVGRVVKRLL